MTTERKPTKRELADFCRFIANGGNFEQFAVDKSKRFKFELGASFAWRAVDKIINDNALARGCYLFPYSDAAVPEVAKAWRKVARQLDHGMEVTW